MDVSLVMDLVWHSIPEMARLLIVLLHREESLERNLRRDHFFDELFIKRFRYYSSFVAAYCGKDLALQDTLTQERAMRRQMGLFQEQLRKTYDFRRLVHWGYDRPWTKLYLVIDTTDATSNVGGNGNSQAPAGSVTIEPGGTSHTLGISKATIDSFRAWAERNTKLTFDIFAVHPIALSDIAAADICAICRDEYENDDLVMQLQCQHRGHSKCLVRSWDIQHILARRCPECRASIPPLINQMGVTSLREEVCYATDNARAATDRAKRSLIRSLKLRGISRKRWVKDLRDIDWYYDESAVLLEAFEARMELYPENNIME